MAGAVSADQWIEVELGSLALETRKEELEEDSVSGEDGLRRHGVSCTFREGGGNLHGEERGNSGEHRREVGIAGKVEQADQMTWRYWSSFPPVNTKAIQASKFGVSNTNAKSCKLHLHKPARPKP